MESQDLNRGLLIPESVHLTSNRGLLQHPTLPGQAQQEANVKQVCSYPRPRPQGSSCPLGQAPTLIFC